MSADLTSLIAEHGAIGYDDIDGCECGADVRTHAAYLAHLAAVIKFSPWLASHDREVAAGAIEAEADAWTQGRWSDVLLPKPTPPAVPVIAYANRMGDWLRDRAQAIREGRA